MSWQKDFFEQSNQLLLYVGRDGERSLSQGLQCHLNVTVEELIHLIATPAKLSQYHQLNLIGQTSVKFGNVYQFERVNQQDNSWAKYLSATNLLHELSLQLSEVPDEDEVIRIAVQYALECLPLDRVGVLLLDAARGQVQGTWGTDIHGNISDEHDFSGPIVDESWVHHALAASDYVAVNEDTRLRQEYEFVGRGWNAMAALFDGSGLMGWVAVDNLIKHKPLEPWLREIIGQFGKTLSAAMSRVRLQKSLIDANHNLEDIVEERNRELLLKIELLQSAQQELVEAMKLASLGSLVAGLAHEVNTPLGVSYTSSTHLQSEVEYVRQKASDGSLTRGDFSEFLERCESATDIIVKNLATVTHMVESFKMLASSNEEHEAENIVFAEFFGQLTNGFNNQPGADQVTWQLDAPEGFIFSWFAPDLTQVLDCLIRNAILHGFDYGPGIITVSVESIEQGTQISFSDNGVGLSGVSAADIFEPFFTTRRANGGIGLGLTVVYNVLNRRGGTIEVADSDVGFKLVMFLPDPAAHQS